MPLQTCPDCGNQVSTQAISCPKCGRPIAPTAPSAPRWPPGPVEVKFAEDPPVDLSWLGPVVALFFVGLAVALVLYDINRYLT